MAKLSMDIHVTGLDELKAFIEVCTDNLSALPEPVILAMAKLSGYAPHQQRVIAEKVQLDDRLQKLGAFLDSDKSGGIAPEERVMLQDQRDCMRDYSDCLQRRIEAWGPQVE